MMMHDWDFRFGEVLSPHKVVKLRLRGSSARDFVPLSEVEVVDNGARNDKSRSTSRVRKDRMAITLTNHHRFREIEGRKVVPKIFHVHPSVVHYSQYPLVMHEFGLLERHDHANILTQQSTGIVRVTASIDVVLAHVQWEALHALQFAI